MNWIRTKLRALTGLDDDRVFTLEELSAEAHAHKRALAFMVALLLVSGVLQGGGTWLSWQSNKSNDHTVATQRQTARLGACAQANESAARSRQSVVDQANVLVAVSTAGQHVPPDKQAQIDSYVAAQKAQAALTFPLRDCSATGIDNFYINAPPAKPCAHGANKQGYCK